MTIAIKPGNVRPVNLSTPYNIPVSFRNQAFLELQAAVRMGIIEKVPPCETSRWFAPMMAVAKKLGGV